MATSPNTARFILEGKKSWIFPKMENAGTRLIMCFHQHFSIKTKKQKTNLQYLSIMLPYLYFPVLSFHSSSNQRAGKTSPFIRYLNVTITLYNYILYIVWLFIIYIKRYSMMYKISFTLLTLVLISWFYFHFLGGISSHSHLSLPHLFS